MYIDGLPVFYNITTRVDRDRELHRTDHFRYPTVPYPALYGKAILLLNFSKILEQIGSERDQTSVHRTDNEINTINEKSHGHTHATITNQVVMVMVSTDMRAVSVQP